MYIYIDRERERVITMKKNYIFEKHFRLTSLSIHYIYISLKTCYIKYLLQFLQLVRNKRLKSSG